ncbi:MAG: Ig-like domain-containing protein, partial [Eubacteriales bacterium]|nr:Ig-like domain-containing protein [Eubacteriales bacterium]
MREGGEDRAAELILEADPSLEEKADEQSLEEVPTEGGEEIQNVDGGEDPAGGAGVSGEEGVPDPVPEDSAVPEEAPLQEGYASYPALTLGQVVTVRITEEEPEKWYRFTPETSGVYALTSAGSCDTRASIYEDPQGEALRENDDASGEDANFALRYVLEAGKTYYYAVQMYGSVMGSFDISMSYVGEAVTEARIASYPQRVYYRELSSPDSGGVSYSGVSLDVVYMDGRTERVRYGDAGLSIENNVKTEILGSGRKVYVPGTYQALVTYGEYTLGYEIQIMASLEEMPELPLDETVAAATQEYCEYFKVTPAEDGEYVIQTACRGEEAYSCYYRIELQDENGEVSPVNTDERYGESNLILGIYSLKAGVTYRIKKFYYYPYYRSAVPAESSIRISKISSMAEGEELTGTEPGYYVRSFVPDATGVYEAAQRSSAEGMRPCEVVVSDFSGNRVLTSFSGYEDGGEYIRSGMAELTEGKTYFLYYPYTGDEAVSTVSLRLRTEEDGLLEKEGTLSLTGTGKSQFVYVRPEQTGIYCLELETENGSSQEGLSRFGWNDWDRYYGNGLKNEGKSYCEVVRLSKGRIYRAEVPSDRIQGGERGSLKLTRIPDVTGLEIIHEPKTEYAEGEIFDAALEGLTVRVTYEDASTEELAYGQASERTGLTLGFSGFPGSQPLELGKYTGWISYLGQEVSLAVKVSGTESEDIETLTEGEMVSATVEYVSSGQLKYRFVPEASGFYRVRSSMAMRIMDGSWEEVRSSDSVGSDDYPYQIDTRLEAGAVYYLCNNTDQSGDYVIQVTRATTGTLTPDGDYDIGISASYDGSWYSFTPESTGVYTVYSFELDGDAYVELYGSAVGAGPLAVNDDGGESRNFRLSYSLKAGETYYYKFKMLGAGIGTYKVHFQDDTPVYSEMQAGQDYKVTFSSNGEEFWYQFTPETSGRYVIYSHGRSDDSIRPVVGLYENPLSYSIGYDNGYENEGDFLLGYDFAAGKDYYVKVSSYNLGSCMVRIQAAPETQSVAAADLSRTYYEHMTTSIDYSELVVKINYEDGTTESLAHGKRSLRTGKKFTVTEPEGMRENGRLKAGTHTLLAGYDGKEGAFSVVVKGTGELDPFAGKLSGAAADFQSGARRLTVESDGWYTLQAKYRTMSLRATVYDGAGNRKYPLDQTSFSYGDYQYASQILELKAEETYLLMLEGTVDQAAEGDYAVLLRMADPLTLDEEQTGTLSEDFALFTFVPSQSGSYTFSSMVTGSSVSYSSSDIALYDKETSIGSGARETDREYDQELGVYRVSYSRGAILTAGKEYLVRLSYPGSYNTGASYTLGVSRTKEVSSLRLVNSPKQVYYYKLDPLTKKTDLGEGTSLKVSYTDGTEETLFYPSASTVSGQRYTLSLSEDTKYSGSGYVLAGSWNAQLTYLNETLSVPVQVKTVGDMPSVGFDESGQGSYSGISEEEDGSGYIRFTAPEDGFYNLTLGAEDDPNVRFLGIFNGAYEKYQYTAQFVPSGDRTLVNASVYVRGGQPCYVKYQRSGAGRVSFSVEGAYDKVITELTLGEEKTVSVEKSNEEKWFSFTPSSSGTYYLNGRDAGSYIRADLYLSPEDPDSQASAQSYSFYYNHGNTNDYDIRLSYALTAGKTYYYKTRYTGSGIGTYHVTLVKEAKAKGLELLTEGQIYCSSLPGFVENSFSNLEFRVTYEDDTTEIMTFGYKGGSERSYSLQGKQIDYDPLSLPETGDQPVGEERITVNFRYDGVSCEVSDVLVCTISGLDPADSDFQAEIGAESHQYYRYEPGDTGYYRVTVSGDSSNGLSVTMFDKYMQEMESLYSNSYWEEGVYRRVRIYRLEGIAGTGDGYCLRLGNGSSAAMTVECTLDKLSPVRDFEISSEPQVNYCLGVDSTFDPAGLSIRITYEDDAEEALAYGERSSITGLSMEVRMDEGTDGSLYLGSSGDKYVRVSYMGVEMMLPICVKDAAEASEMTDAEAVSGIIEGERDYAYVKYTPAKSGFYDFMLTGEAGTVPHISYIKNASYKEIGSFDYYVDGFRYDSSLTVSGESSTRHCLAYLLEGKTYYMKGSLSRDGAGVSGSYAASVEPLEDLKESSGRDNLGAGVIAPYQFTPWADGYYQFTLQGVEKGAVRIYSSGFRPVNATYEEEIGRKHAAAKLWAGNTYFVACVNQGSGENAYFVQADKRPEVTSVSISQEPEKTVYYAQFENSLNLEGLVASIHYADGTQEELAYGESSQWGLSLALDTADVQKDENGRFVTGAQTVGVTYLDKRASFTIDVQDFDIASAPSIKAGLWEDVELPAGASAFYVFTPENDVEYRYYSRGDTAVVGYIYDSTCKLLLSGTGEGEKDFSLNCTLTKGESYILRVRGLSAREPLSTRIRVHDTTAWKEVTGLSLSREELTLGGIGAEEALTAIVEPADATYKDQIFWSSADPQIASVNEEGVVTAQKEGETTVTAMAEDGGYQASCAVRVDLEDPVLTEVYPVDQTVMGASAGTMWIYAEDNVGVEKVVVEYRKSTETEYTRSVDSDKDEENGQKSVNKAQLPMGDDYFQDGDEICVRVTAHDKGGRESQPQERTYVIDKVAPSVTEGSAVYNPETRTVDVTWKGNKEEDISDYAIYRKEKDASEEAYRYLGTHQGYVDKEDYSYTDGTVENKDQVYTYKIVASDQRGNRAELVLGDTEVTRVNEAPVIRLSCQSTMEFGEEYAFDLSGSTDDGSIVSWKVDYGDGQTEEGQGDVTSYTHAYALSEGTLDAAYTVTVTATDDEGAAATLEKTVRVVNLKDASMVTVTVIDEQGLALADAPVYVNMGEDTEDQLTTDSKGKVEYIALPGFTTVGSYMKGYLPVKETVQTKAGELAEVTLILEKRELAEARFESHRMTLDEIREAGIDLNDPDNQHVVEYKATLEYVGTRKSSGRTVYVNWYYNGTGASGIRFYGSGGGGGGDGGGGCGTGRVGGGYTYITDETYEIVVILEIPIKASILKEFYEVNMYILNNASEEFSLLENHVSLNVPDGLTVMEAEGAAAAELDIPEIKGQTTELVTWILRGDKEGEYDLSADYRGVLSEFNEPVSATFKSDKKITVFGVSNMDITLQIPETFEDGEFYYNLVMKNKGTGNDADMYLPQLSGAGDLIQTKYTKEDGTAVCVDEMPEVLRAGESITKNYLITDQIYDQLHEKYPDYKSFVFHFRRMWVEEISSYGLPLNVEFLTWEDMKATYDRYRAQVPEVTKLEATGAAYGYEEGEAYLEVEGKAAEGAEYELSYEWYDTSYDAQPIGEGPKFVVPVGLEAGEHHYHCVVIATRTDNRNKAQTQYQDVVLTITPRMADLKWSGDGARTYDGSASDVTAEVENLVEGDACTVTVAGGTEKDAGAHTAEATGLDNGNYTLPEEASNSYTIYPKEISLSWSGNAERTYDGADSNVTAAAEGLVEGDECAVTVTGGTEKNAGTYTATATGLDNGNYVLPEEASCSYTIRPKVIDLSWNGNEERIYDGTNSNVRATAEGLVEGDVCTVTVTGGTEKNAGTYTATATGLDNGNYVLPAEASCNYTILPKEVSLSWSGNEERIYDGTASNVTAAAGGLVEGDECAVTVAGGTAKDAGTHTATATALDNGNYALPAEASCDYTILPKEVSLSWSGNEERIYDGTASNVTAAAGGLVEGDECAVTVAGGTAKDAG